MLNMGFVVLMLDCLLWYVAMNIEVLSSVLVESREVYSGFVEPAVVMCVLCPCGRKVADCQGWARIDVVKLSREKLA
jgi:hypothetical protein